MSANNQIPDDFFNNSLMLFAATYAPMGWLYCEGQLLQCEYLQDLFKILGTTYGGDGITNFGLPDLTDSEKELGGVRYTIFAQGKIFEFYNSDFIATVLPTLESLESDDWKFCNGQLLPISDYIGLYSICGIKYGGNGVDNFALPDLREVGAKINTKYMICVKGLFPTRW